MNRARKYILAAAFGVSAASVIDAQSVSTQPVDVAVLFNAEHTQYSYGSNFWLYGGSGEVAVRFHYNLGLVVNATGVSSSGSATSQSFSKIMTTAGPRYRLPLKHMRSQLFVEGLFGGVHGFDSVFPSANGPLPSANAFAMQLGGGYDLSLNRTWSLRVIDIHYLRTDLPNGATNQQHDLLIGAGIVWRPIDHSSDGR
jgi:outer membrane immunogenic protein